MKRFHLIKNKFNFSPLTVENFRDIIKMICDDVINMAIAENIIYEVIKNPTISAQQVLVPYLSYTFIFRFWISNFFIKQFQYVIENNQQVLKDPEELRKLCQFCVEKYDKVTRKARRGKEGEFEKLVKAVMKESNKRADIPLAKTILQELLQSK